MPAKSLLQMAMAVAIKNVKCEFGILQQTTLEDLKTVSLLSSKSKLVTNAHLVE